VRRIGERTFKEVLGRESERWVADGLITADQAAALRSRYEGEGAPESELRSRAAAVLAVVGGTAVGVGVIGFVAANWNGIGHGLRLALLTTVIASAYAGAYHLRERTGSHPRVGEALYLAGLLVFGASLFLVGQMYHVEAHDPLALLIWAGAAVAVAILVRTPPLSWAALLIFTGWIGFEAGTALEDSGSDDFTAFPAVAVFYGGALYGLGTAAETRIREAWFVETAFAPAARRLGFVLAASGLFVFTFSGATDELSGSAGELSGAFEAGLLVLAALALAGAAALAVSGRPRARFEAGALAVAVVTLLVAGYAGGSGDLYAVLFNLLVAAVALGTVYVGYLSEEAWLVNVGVGLVAADLIARYFDFFWSALPRSVGMIGAGILILGIAFVLERQRKQLLTRMDA
jgi:uncharacterized membrane protein